MNRQDRNGVRTAQDLERKYDLASIVGMKKAIRQTEEGLTKTDTILENFMKEALGDIENLQSQIDGNITTYFHSGVPTMNNFPVNEWEDSYDNHLGDLYYDEDTGKAYRFSKSGEEYCWNEVTDSSTAEALALAKAAQDTADSKRRVFVATPVPPYDNGDLWFTESKEIYICQISKPKGESYAENDFIVATKYTDDTLAKKVGEELTVVKGTVTTIRESMDRFEIEIESAKKSATDFLRYDGTNGLQIGNRTGEDWSGYRSQMLPDSFNILDEGGNPLAKYQADAIYLGLDATTDEAKIDLLNGSAKMYAMKSDDTFCGLDMYAEQYFDIHSNDQVSLYSNYYENDMVAFTRILQNTRNVVSETGTPYPNINLKCDLGKAIWLSGSKYPSHSFVGGDLTSTEIDMDAERILLQYNLESNVVGEGVNKGLRIDGNDVGIVTESLSYSLLGLAKAISNSYTMTCTPTAGTGWSNVSATAYLMGNCLRVGISAKRNENPLTGNQTNETVMKIKVDSGGKIQSLYRVSFCNDTEGSVASFSAQAVNNDDGTQTITVLMTATTPYNSSATTGSATYNGYFVMPADIKLAAYV